MLHPKLRAYVHDLEAGLAPVNPDRIRLLSGLSDYVSSRKRAKLHFICTHNSRRSLLAQVWAQTAAFYYQLPIHTYSGGTESTAFHANAVGALVRAGFEIQGSNQENPRYEVSYAEEADPLMCYSKTFDAVENPKSNFAAIMTCSEADAECPVVSGADHRAKLFYDDPKIADGTSDQDQVYNERCQQIAQEMFFVFHHAKELIR